MMKETKTLKDTQDSLQEIILRNLITNDKYMRKVVPHIDPAYFEGIYSNLFKCLVKYVAKYNRLPTQETFLIYMPDSGLFGNKIEDAMLLVPDLFSKVDIDETWLLDSTEQWCQDRALFNAMMQSISIMNGDTEKFTKQAIPDLLTKALSVAFDINVGHDYLENAAARYDFYHEDLERIPFDIDILNIITKGGLVRKSLNVLMGGTGGGKSLSMCHMAAANLSMGHNVLYITAEMAEERIAERIDANLLNVEIDQLVNLSKDMLVDRVSGIAKKTKGNLIIKEYPTGQAHSGHIRALLNELKLKKGFVPDIIYLDYLNIFASSRLKAGGGTGDGYYYVKSVAEEMRGLAVEFDIALVTATQLNRDGFDNSDPTLKNTSESFGLPATSDLFLVLVTNEELDAHGQIMFKQLKNRYAEMTKNRRFVVGINRAKMQLFDVADPTVDLVKDTPQAEDDIPLFDKGSFGGGMRAERDYSALNV